MYAHINARFGFVRVRFDVYWVGNEWMVCCCQCIMGIGFVKWIFSSKYFLFLGLITFEYGLNIFCIKIILTWIMKQNLKYNPCLTKYPCKNLSSPNHSFRHTIHSLISLNEWTNSKCFILSFVQFSERHSYIDVIATFREGHVSTNKLIGRAMPRRKIGHLFYFYLAIDMFCGVARV